MYAEIQGGLSALKGALDLVRAAKGVVDQAQMASALSEVQQQLMETLGAALKTIEDNANLTRRVQDLERELAEREDWKALASSYELSQIAPGVSAWTERARQGTLLDAVKLCSNCFGQHEKSILQMQNEHVNRDRSLHCARCKDKLVFRHFVDHS